ncbi:MAG: hypothetical protein MUF25_29225, partial [Pirellulaceae bacterium]|nr:hypothetical protein [Pirellulaceae bacterium]
MNEPLPLYRSRDSHASDLWRLLEQHFETFQQVDDERFAAKYGFWRPNDGIAVADTHRSEPDTDP